MERSRRVVRKRYTVATLHPQSNAYERQGSQGNRFYITNAKHESFYVR